MRFNQFYTILDFINKDLEDTIQSVLAKKVRYDLIIYNDEIFISDYMAFMNAKSFCESAS